MIDACTNGDACVCRDGDVSMMAEFIFQPHVQSPVRVRERDREMGNTTTTERVKLQTDI